VLGALECGCGDGDSDDTPETAPRGTLAVHMEVGDNVPKSAGSPGPKVVHSGLEIVDVRHTLYGIQATMDAVVAGQPDNLAWHTVYSGATEALDSELAMSASLPAGEYAAVKITQSNYMYWVCNYGPGTVELYSLNDGGRPPGAQIVCVFAADAPYVINASGDFEAAGGGEKLGSTFSIIEGLTTHLTIRCNLDTLDWDDADGSGTWTSGDGLDNWTTIPGTTTMADFTVEYPLGTLSVPLAVGDYGKRSAPGSKGVHYGLDVTDLRQVVHGVYVTGDAVLAGEPDDLVWQEVYTSSSEDLDSARAISREVPVGSYRAVKIVYSNCGYIVCTDGANTYELYDLKDGLAAPGDQIANVHATDGFYVVDSSGDFELRDAAEGLDAPVGVRYQQTTTLTRQINFDTVDWDDGDSSGTWTAGDSVVGGTMIPGTTKEIDWLVQ
jgi:hypothetical protein